MPTASNRQEATAPVEELLRKVEQSMSRGASLGLLRAVAEDEKLNGRTVVVDGRNLINFGSCSYLGLETHPVLTSAVAEAALRYGTQFASSRVYLSAPQYSTVENALTELFGRPTALFSSTTLGHMATIPTLAGPDDVLMLDAQVHETVRMASVMARSQGTEVRTTPHSNVRALDRRLGELARNHRRVWYAADGLYSMYGDFAPITALGELTERYENLWLYIDDAHSISWAGRHGRGFALEHLSSAALERTIVTGSLNKSFAATGGAITFPDHESMATVAYLSGPSIFCGPIQPPLLAAVLASTKLHMSDEVAERQRLLLTKIRRFNAATARHGLPLLSRDETPIRYVATSGDVCWTLASRLRDTGFFVNVADYPAVPSARAGLRIPLTMHHTDDDIDDLVDTIADLLPLAAADAGRSPADLARVLSRAARGRP